MFSLLLWVTLCQAFIKLFPANLATITEDLSIEFNAASEGNMRLGNHVCKSLAVLVLMAGLVRTAEANGCGVVHETPTPTVTERTIAAPIVIEGRVTALSASEARSVASVQVYQYLKGSGPALVNISGFHEFWTLYDCPDWVSVGDHLIFYASGEPESGQLHTFVVGARGSTTPASSENLNEAMAMAGQSPVTPLPTSTSTPDASSSAIFVMLLAGSAAVVFVWAAIHAKRMNQKRRRVP